MSLLWSWTGQLHHHLLGSSSSKPRRPGLALDPETVASIARWHQTLPDFFHPKIVLSSSVKSLKILQEVLGIRGMKYRIQFYSRSHQEATEAYLGSLEYKEWHSAFNFMAAAMKLLKLIWDPWNTRTTRSYWRMEYHIQFSILCPMKDMQEGGAQITLAEWVVIFIFLMIDVKQIGNK